MLNHVIILLFTNDKCTLLRRFRDYYTPNEVLTHVRIGKRLKFDVWSKSTSYCALDHNRSISQIMMTEVVQKYRQTNNRHYKNQGGLFK